MLGATPGIRALLRGSDAKVCVVDYSRAMYRAMNRLLPHEVVRGETSYLCANWLDLDQALEKNSLDLVLGDLVFLQIPSPSLRKRLFQAVHAVLKPQGRFVTRTKMFNPRWKEADTQEIIRLDMKMYSVPQASFRGYLSYRLGDKLLNLDSETFKIADFLSSLERALPQAATPDEYRFILHACKWYFPIASGFCRAHCLLDRYEDLARSFFTIREKLCAGDYPESDFFPMHVFQKE